MHVIAIVIADDASAADISRFVGAARRIASGALQALIIDSEGRDTLAHQALRAGAQSVELVSHALLAKPLQSDQLLAVLMQALPALRQRAGNGATLVLLPAGALGEELAARLAVRLDGVTLGRCADLRIESGLLVAHRPAFGGRVTVKLGSHGQLNFATIRPDRANGGKPSAEAEGDAAVILGDSVHRMAPPDSLPSVTHVEWVPITSQKQRLEGARLVVSGGRGMHGVDGFEQLGALATALGGALGGSLPAVDAGWVPVSSQVGQSGKYVTPAVYVAVGISGTPQHLAGIGSQTQIIAINNDPEANIFNEAQIGILADWHALLPAVMEQLATQR